MYKSAQCTVVIRAVKGLREILQLLKAPSGTVTIQNLIRHYTHQGFGCRSLSKQRSLKLSVYYEFCEHLYCLLTMATMVLTAWEVVSSPLGRATMQEPRQATQKVTPSSTQSELWQHSSSSSTTQIFFTQFTNIFTELVAKLFLNLTDLILMPPISKLL